MINWKTVVGFLAEADDELRVLHWRLHWLQFREMREDCPQSDAAKYTCWFARLEKERPLNEGSLFGCLQHVFRLLNWAWNCRRTSDERLLCYTGRDERNGGYSRVLRFSPIFGRSLEAPGTRRARMRFRRAARSST